MKEYGSNIQKIADYIVSMPEKEQRTKSAHILIELMRQIHPNMREGQDYSKKLWDDLYVITNFDLDVDSPFPAPPKEILGKKPMIVPYNQNRLKQRYYGRNLEILVLKAIVTETYEDRVAFVSYLVRFMKQCYLAWNKDTVETDTCLDQLMDYSGGRLQKEIDEVRKNGLMESSPKDGNSNRQRTPQNPSQRSSYSRNDRNDRNDRDRENQRSFGSNNNMRNSRDNRGGDNRDNRNNNRGDSRNGGGFGNNFGSNNNRNRDNRDNNRNNRDSRDRGRR